MLIKIISLLFIISSFILSYGCSSFPRFSQNIIKFPKTSSSLPNSIDAKILTSMEVLNKNEINAAQIALKKSSNKETRNFAKWMISAHTKNLSQAEKLSQSLNFAPDFGDISYKLKKEGLKEAHKLQELKGSTFDISYINSMVEDHRAALGLIDQFILSSKDSSVKKYLKATRIHVNGHLKRAEYLQRKLK